MYVMEHLNVSTYFLQVYPYYMVVTNVYTTQCFEIATSIVLAVQRS